MHHLLSFVALLGLFAFPLSAFAQDLALLKDQLPPFPIEQAKAEVERQLGRPVEQLFASFEPAVAAASLAFRRPSTMGRNPRAVRRR